MAHKTQTSMSPHLGAPDAEMESTSDVDRLFIQATDNLIALYRGIERRTLDLPFVSFMPLLIFLWSVMKFYFFLIVGLVLIIPTNLVILVRNFFPGHWRYRPFFLRHLYYAWLWIWRGEAPTSPGIFVRPFLKIFMRGHFDRRLRRLRAEILLRDELSDATRSALLARLDAALERWKPAPLQALFFSVLFPAVISFPSWWKAWTELLKSFGIHIPTELVGNVVPNISPILLIFFGATACSYALTIPTTGFMAKRGLFIGGEVDMICFPGRQEGCGAYRKEREILGGVGLHACESPIDLWLLGFAVVLSLFFTLFVWDLYMSFIQSELIAYIPSMRPDLMGGVEFQRDNVSKLPNLISIIVIGLLLPVAALLRRRAVRV
ncbi:hypothetical protein [Bradyrhizobium neotropicale]|uniref:hypothetical protein n=1 Tax=Bradyrhizobium neotropicale TaxID=1497615 RepID=UPI001AD6CA76|nr:hypothetical protein [Bradyrhizobium neotropicale]MBO4224889.1 hypothetical protein [Bradyrhizobium neotropicale]